MWNAQNLPAWVVRAGRIGWKLVQVILFVLAFLYSLWFCLAGKFWRTPELSFTCPLLLPLLIAAIIYATVRLVREIRK